MATSIAIVRIMWQCWILLLCATGISCAVIEPQSFSVNAPTNNRSRNSGSRIRRFACPVGFFRLNRQCYYLSAGKAPWLEAHFHCKDRNSTLASPDKKGKDRKLRQYLMGEQFAKLERWIGGIYDWHGMAWQWGVSGEKIVFQNFEKLEPGNPEQYAWHCIVMNPNVGYMWQPRSCVERKHYVCEVPAGRLERRRRMKIDRNLVPQNQRQKPRKGKKYNKKGEGKNRRRYRVQSDWKRDGEMQNGSEQWANGVKLGSRPPANMRLSNETRRGNRKRHRARKLYPGTNAPKIMQVAPHGQEYGSFLGDGPARTQNRALSEDNAAMNQFQGKINDLSLEEILLKT